MSGQKENESRREVLRYTREPLRSRAWVPVVYASLCTLGIFVILPFSQWLDVSRVEDLEIRTVDATHLKAKPPEIKELIPPEPIAEKKETSKHRNKPRLEKPKTSKPKRTRLPVSLDLGTRDFTGDFSLNFSVLPQEPELDVDTANDPVIFNPSEVDSQPIPIVRNEPVYPYRARRREIEGYVTVRFVVEADGHVSDVKVVHAEPEKIFDKAVEKTVKTWRFDPAIKDGEPVAMNAEIKLYFNIKDR